MGKRRRHSVGEGADNEAEYEKAGARKFADAATDDKLPVLGVDGKFRRSGDDDNAKKFVRRQRPEGRLKPGTGGRSGDDVVSNKDEGQNGAEVGGKRTKVSRALSVSAARARVAEICTLITASPTKNLNLLEELRKMRTTTSNHVDVRALAFASEAQVFVDISPGYLIKDLTDAEKTAKVSREVRRVRDFEQQLRAKYNRFVSDVVAASSEPSNELFPYACRVLAALLTSLSHFNNAKEVAEAVVGMLDSRDEKIRRFASDSISAVLSETERSPEGILGVCVFLTQGICALAERRRHKLPPEAVEPLLKVRIGALLRAAQIVELKEEKMSKGAGKSKKQQGRNAEIEKVESELRRDMLMSQAETSATSRRRAADSLQSNICITYVRVLHGAPSTPKALSAVLTGINNIAQFLSTDVVSALLDAISPLIANETLPLKPSFKAIASFFDLVRKHQQAQGYDPAEPTRLEKLLTNSLRRMCKSSFKISEDLALAVIAAVEASLRHKSINTIYVAISRLLLVASAACDLHSVALSFVALAKRAHPDPSEAIDFSSAEAKVAGGLDDAVGGDLPTSAWELVLLSHHFHPSVAASAANFGRVSTQKVDCAAILRSHRTASGGFNPQIQPRISQSRKTKARDRSRETLTTPEEKLTDDFLLDHYFVGRLALAREQHAAVT
mmetsp:Transcript_3415/g.10361  ORF Transcript_3415/g.10361 Transcript_3415/m.10361 type:complete len:673 (+) Transcript_3415:159-2177(+)|eukprot:CAMPEP_0198726294 /NCGR_PEP_ID=MMETSP1475-20131203/3394_1 /TAXON_ID= ORGANISM="Unidentified sp., Strain CCMP1999" /NCGR_SAMPLE_ID=MMETSP1475 /ASSEMBLY_ACC=CAM_ASM_001111 /LENGTH=672 /DNA_ID=CAMNT_0044488201 /DNA_START=94 /DNA_END=2112 /DNA_ORIENTATION=+